MAYRMFAGRGRLVAPGLVGVLMTAGCASTLDVRTLATERADVSAYELTGRDLDALRRDARQLCPQGGEILRQSARDQRVEAVDSRMERWVHFSSTWITPTERHAQLVVLCHPVTGRHLLAAAPAVLPAVAAPAALPSPAPATVPAAVSAAGPGVPGVLGVPIGPLSVEW